MPRMKKIVKTAAGLVVLLLFVVASAIALYAWRSFPQLSGRLQAPGLQAPVKIGRDAADVTHIQALSDTDAAFALGYTHAQERSWQLEFNRRVMHGELSAILGPATLETDKLMRSLGIVRSAQKQFDALPPEARAMLTAYANGINGFHASSSQALPPEFHILQTQPGLWSPVDSVGWGLMMALDLGGNWGNEIARLSVAQRLGTAQMWQLFPPYPGEPPASSIDFAKLYADLAVYRPAADAPVAANALKTIANYLIDTPANIDFSSHIAAWTEAIGNTEGKGSNNWVVAGSHSASGKPLLANDPHLGLSAPAIWYFARLQYPGVDVIGATLPGLPSVILGRNAKVAWGFTNTGPDVQDVYLEQINPANPNQYRTPTGFADFIVRSETIAIKGQGAATFRMRETRHGPVISDVQTSVASLVNTATYALALRWSALDADNRTILAGMKAQRASSVAELFAAYADYHSPMQNVVAADTAGAVGFKAVGRVPLRAANNDIQGIAPSPGWLAQYDWTGWLPYAQTPSSVAPKGYLATANQRITEPGYPHFLTQDWATPQRFDRISALLAATPKHDMASMQAIQSDTTSLATQSLLPTLRKARSSHPLAPAALQALQGFDGDMRANSAAPLIFAAWADELARGLIAPRLGQDKFNALYGKRHFRGTVEHIMQTNDVQWCAPKTCDQQSSDALARALDRLQIAQGSDVVAWQWGRAHVARSIHRPLGNVAPLAKAYDVTAPTGGDPWSVNVGQYWLNEKQPFENRHAASLRTVFDLADLEKSVFIYQTGQSGLVFSPRYRDMSAQWSAEQVQYRPLQLQPAAMVHALELLP